MRFIVLLLFCFLLLGLLPLVSLFAKAFLNEQGHFIGFANIREFFQTPYLRTTIENTIKVSSLSTLIALVAGFSYAYALNRTHIPWKPFFYTVALLPLFAPTLLYGIGLVYLFGNKGLVTTGFFGLLPGFNIRLYGPVGIVISEAVYTFPQVFLILSIALKNTDFRFYEVAESMGVSKLRRFLTITLPGLKYALVSSAFLGFTLAFTDFGAPKIVGGRYDVLAIEIYKQVVGQQNFSMGAVVGLILLIPAVPAFLINQFYGKKRNFSLSSRSKPYRIHHSPLRDRLYLTLCLLISLFILSIILVVLYASFVKTWPYNFSLTLQNYFFGESSVGAWDSFFNSLKTSLLTAVLGTCLVFINAYLIEKLDYWKPLRQINYFLSILPASIPGLVIGISYIFFFNSPSNPFNGLYGTIWILVLANIIHFYSVPFITATTALKKIDREIEQVSQSMGVPPERTFIRVTVPLSFTAVTEIFSYFFVNSMVTVSAVIFLYFPLLKLASVSIVNMEDAGDIASASAMAILVVGANLIFKLTHGFFFQEKNPLMTRNKKGNL